MEILVEAGQVPDTSKQARHQKLKRNKKRDSQKEPTWQQSSLEVIKDMHRCYAVQDVGEI